MSNKKHESKVGGCVSIDNSNDENEDLNAELNIEGCDFDGCSVLADESKGAAICAQLKRNIQLNIISCTITGCTAPAEEGKTGFGGGMALKLIDHYSSFVISSPVFDFEKPNIAKYGNDLGFDGSNTTNAIPLVNFWRAIGSEIFVGGEGKNMGACGFSDYPCLSIEYSLDRLPEGNEKNINIIEKGVLQKSVDLGGISICSNNTDMCALECLSSLEAAEEAAMKIQGITKFELINFVIPSSFMSGVNYLMHVGASDGLLTLKDCSFTKNEESEEETIMFGLIKADRGTVKFEFVSMQSLCFSKDVISMLSTTILNIKNLMTKNIQVDGKSGLRISKRTAERIEGIYEADKIIVIEWSLFEEVFQNTTKNVQRSQSEHLLVRVPVLCAPSRRHNPTLPHHPSNLCKSPDRVF
ncbi:uncharacterized protein MONOS_7904 [Monocercomonoides exilis]|uniref:uncharacterized protein n=1 Tax=Monocercomonoides exilis TaxID=2049356 RepID=UPI00355AB198|nr:hypothetical protein MONOS_7904 [Monocercomonoides exilis]|eukprot:MONOS_7904.1-p1 / transcript=MONOS_7904.1 / gene=MONOS_7904 / organism=Monocercomonoides_exilis_PA203 / gene_product=unspecified product / transcript_product=unspecified product / location=Mono_scaffold00283:46669-48052(+) / protein_length=412 / sequence_SO=supercontig / SO=protein_coding / is_pseudo=false